jgi:hypothetical protein
VPADGRLNTPDYLAKVTAVAWPARNGGAEPTPGRRFVQFTLDVSAPNQSSSPTSPNPSLSAALSWDGTSHPLSLTTIDDELQSGAGGSGDSASASYMATVPNDTHDIDLELSEGTFSQSFNLWRLQRVPPTPAALYRNPNGTTVTGTATAPTTLSLSNPADGFTSSATVTLQSATLGYIAPSGTTLSPSPDQAVLSVVLDGEHPNDPNDPTGSGHYLGSSAPLPAGLLSFTPTGGTPAPAAMSDSGDTNGKGNSDDGLFDATYSFLVPATLTGGTLDVAAGSFSGTEFTLYTAESGTTTLDVAAPTTLALSFPAVVAAAAQKTPPWVGQPDPPTAAASAPTSPGATGSTSPHGFPIWVAIVVLVVLAAGVVLFERWRRRRQLTIASSMATAPAMPANHVDVVAPTPDVGEPEVFEAVAGSEADLARGRIEDSEDLDVVLTGAPVVATPAMGPSTAPLDSAPALNVLGHREILGLEIDGGSLVDELFPYLVFHDHRHLKAAQIAIGLRPNGSRDLDEKTVRNALTRLRRCIGAEHLPEATSDGYLIVGIRCDCVTFERLARQADTTGGEEAIGLRKEALALVRGAPFADLNDEWVDAERFRSNMVVAIVKCATRLATDLLEAKHPSEAEEAASAGLRGAVRHYVLWELGAWAIRERSDRGRLELWMADAKASLDEEDYVRLERSVADHRDLPAS